MARKVSGSDSIRSTTLSMGAAGPFTVSGWVNLASVSPSSDALSNGDLSNTLLRIFLFEGASTNVWHISVPAVYDINCGFSAMTAGTWYHLCAVFGTGSQLSVFQNGVASGSNPFSQTTSNPSGGHFSMGSFDSGGSPSNQFGGSIADVAVWSIALTAGEIAALAAGARPYQIRPTSLLRYYPLDGLQSPEPDLSGNAVNATVVGTSLQPGPPVMPFTPRQPQFLTPAANTFNPAWTRGRNQFIEGFAS